jgi:hypothetical protein
MGTIGVAMNRLRYQLLAGPGLAKQQDGRVPRSDFFHQLQHISKRGTRPNDLIKVPLIANLINL